ncbi:MAG: universal stress protein [Aquincola sp.]|nr:universal stress protein [Aquincola sp.]MDH5330669.1 universal stress protein [Aquincola sp.]
MFKRILIVVDPRPVARIAVKDGTALAKVHGAEVIFFYTLPHYPVPTVDAPLWISLSEDDFESAARSEAGRMLAAAAVVADKNGVKHRSAMGRAHDDAKEIIDVARARRCDLIVVGSEGRNAVLRLVLGSVIPGLITAAPMPVMVCKDRRPLAVKQSAVIVPLRKAPVRRARAAM